PGGTFLLLLSWIILKNNKRVNTREKIIIGFVVGVLTAFQLYFSTWVIGAIVSFAANEWYSNKEITGVIKTSFIIGFSSLAGFFIITLPIYKNLPEFFSFVLELATHEGLYGNGREGFTSPQRYLGNLFIYSKILPYLFLTILCLIIALHFLIFIKNWKINPGIKAFTLGIFIQIFIAVSIILKHPMQIYFLSIAAMAPMLFAILIHIIDKNGDKVKEKFIINTKNNSIGLNQISIISIFFIMMILFGINFQTAVNNHILRMERISEDLSTINRTLSAYSEQRSTRPEKINLLWTYETYSPCYARWYGNDYADLAFTTELAQICKNNLHVNLWTGQILTDNGWESPNEYVWDIIVLKAGIVNFLPKVLEYGNFIEIGDTDIAVIVPPNAPLDFVHYID
ncbi:MAG: hypothetical protein GWO26_10895, partial [Phycisphaerae bacterium]|nr:hypothetical protein [Phycisphaerae bacterium]